MIGILDYGLGNLYSVYNALIYLGADVMIVNDNKNISNLTSLIIPGVGSFKKAMENLSDKKMIKPIKDFAISGKPLLGICLGMQLLATSGYEPSKTSGLGLISGQVKLLNTNMRLPHVGWNNIELIKKNKLFDGVKTNADFYFVHSYHFSPNNSNTIITKTDYNSQFVSGINKENIYGLQFHPEKSQKQGLNILRNFIQLSNA